MKSIILLFLLISHIGATDNWPVLKGPYLGQKPPGHIPEIFAPGLLNNPVMGAFCTVFSPDGTEFYFSYYQRTGDTCDLFCMKQIGGFWKKPEKLHFNSASYENDVCISTDGKRLVFRSWRALPSGRKPKDHSFLWYVTRAAHGWSDAKPLLCGGEPVRTGYPSMSRDDSLYFAHRQNGRLGIYRSRLQKGHYSRPEFVYEAFNQDFILGDLFVAPDESYIIFSGRPPAKSEEFSRLDLYVTFRDREKKWSKPLKMGNNINTKLGGENCPAVSPDGKYFFFNRYDPDKKKGNMYWLKADIISNMKNKIITIQEK